MLDSSPCDSDSRVYFVFQVVYSSYHCPESPDAPRYHLCKKHQAQELCLTTCCQVLLWGFRMRSLRPSMGQSNLGKSRRNDPKLQAELGPHPNQTSQELCWFIFTFVCWLCTSWPWRGPCAEDAGRLQALVQLLLKFAELLLAAGAAQLTWGLAEPTHRRSPSS